MKICIVGTGYVGLVTGACLASVGNDVTCVDVDAKKVESLKQGVVTIYEPRLENLVRENLDNGRLQFTTDLAQGINTAAVVFMAVGTPQDEDGSADMRYVYQVCEDICKVATKEVVLATKSTVPVGTGDQIEALFKAKLKVPYVVFSNPEFLKEGDAVNDFMKPDRVVVGLNDERVRGLLEELYEPFNHQKNRLHFMSRRSAEITKYAANAMLALRISFMNEMARLCDKMGADVNHVRVGIGTDPRIGSQFLYPSLGFGGSCFPKDVSALIRVAKDEGVNMRTLHALQEVNRDQPVYFLEKLFGAFGGREQIKGKTIAMWGLTFKAKTDDIRYSQALRVVDILLECGAQVKAYDPKGMSHVAEQYGKKIDLQKSMMDCVVGADALVLATEWDEFKSPDFAKMKSVMKSAKIFDGRNLYQRKKVQNHGFEYFGIGV